MTRTEVGIKRVDAFTVGIGMNMKWKYNAHYRDGSVAPITGSEYKRLLVQLGQKDTTS